MNDGDWTRIDRVLAGEATEAEAAELEAWAGRDPRNAALLAALRDPASFGGAPGGDTDAAWLRLRERVTDEPAHVPRRTWLRAAAIVLLLMSGALLWRVLTLPAPGAVRLTLVADARPDTVQLEDGTMVIVAAGGRLAWTEPFAADARSVTLEGEALFDVVRDATRPFTIDATPVTVTVIGTRFVLRAWPERLRAEVAVVEGAVRVAGGAAEVVVEAGRAATFADAAITLRDGVDFAAETAWTTGRMVFDDAPLASVLPRLARRFDLEFVVDDPDLEARRVTASFDDPDADRVLDALSLALGLRFERADRTVRVRAAP